MRSLKGAPAPPEGTRMPGTLDYVYEARPSLGPVFDTSSKLGQGLVGELTTVTPPEGATGGSKRFKPEQPGGYYALLRETVRKGELDEDVRHPVITEEVLKEPVPRIPAPVNSAIAEWLSTAELPDRGLPDEVRAAIREALNGVVLEHETRGDMVVVTLPRAVMERIEAALAKGEKSHPGKSAVFAWWRANYGKLEHHHVWPKWLLGDERQVGMMLPRCVHNMAGGELHEGGFHQVLDRMFAEDPEFARARLSPSEPGRVTQFIRQHPNRIRVLQRIRDLLEDAYEYVLTDPRVQAHVAERLRFELQKLAGGVM